MLPTGMVADNTLLVVRGDPKPGTQTGLFR
jgi:hypothetical protein